jgi:hypothetical protein
MLYFERAVAAAVTLVGVVGGIVGAAASENFSLIGAGSFTAFALAGFTLMWRTWSKENKRQSARSLRLEIGLFKAEWRENELRSWLRNEGIAVPRSVFQDPPTEVIHAAFGDHVAA